MKIKAKMCEISCDVDDCMHNTGGICGEPGSISISDMVSCIEMSCAHKLPEDEEEIVYCLNSGLSVDECLDCEGECKTEEDK